MKSYLSLIPISAKVHKHKNRMTLFCIIIAVFLVTAIFSMADMTVRMEKIRAISNHGNWHIQLNNLKKSDADLICSRSDVAAASAYDVINYERDDDYYIGGKKAVLCGSDESFVTDIMNCVDTGVYPQNDGEVMLSENAKDVLGLNIGENITLSTPSGSVDYTISGFSNNTAFMMQYDTIGMNMNMNSFNEIHDNENYGDSNPVYYVQFKNHTNIQNVITEIKEEYQLTDNDIGQNTALLGVMGVSTDSYIVGLYLIAIILFLLILMSGVLMIAGSINSNITERTQFFGMMRCIGASRKQIIRFVRLEALNWCKTAVPIGVLLGIISTWGLCTLLRIVDGGEFSYMPIFGISILGIICGIIVGILTVLFAAQAPAKRAAKVSPVTAISGNNAMIKNSHHATNMRFLHIETALGINHAVSAKKNLILMTGSFALSIILFLSFSAALAWVHQALPNLRPYTPDLSIVSYDYSSSVDKNLISEINSMTGVKRVFGRMFSNDVASEYCGNSGNIDLISYEENQLNWAKKDISKGDLSKVFGDNNYVLTVFDKSNPLNVGDKIQLCGTEVEVAGILSTSPFDNTEGTPTVICSEETFTRLTGENNYAIIDIQMTSNATDDNVEAIRELAGEGHIFSDRRINNKDVKGLFWTFRLVVYTFLAIIAMITIFNIINSISMSVSARLKQYGAMRAVGMTGRQTTKMIAAEAATYALSGCIVGCVLGMPLYKFFFSRLITAYYGIAPGIPILELAIILLIVVGACAVSVYIPSKRIKNMAVTDTINEH